MLESVILANLIFSEEYCRKVIPFLKPIYFEEKSHQWTFKLIEDFLIKYNKISTKDVLQIDLMARNDISEQEKRVTQPFIATLEPTDHELDWLVDKTEKWVQDRAIYLGIKECIDILDDKTGKVVRTKIPTILQDALSISFDTNIGHDFVEDAEKRWDFYHTDCKRVPFDLSLFNDITGGGVKEKTLNVLMGGVGFGKTQFMCHFAGANLTMGKNVLYITLEMAEEEISKRIDANLLDVPLSDLEDLTREQYLARHEELRKKTLGKLIIKEYAEGTAGAGHFRHLLDELRIKKKFIPDIIYVDYLNLCCSTRVKLANSGLYTYVKFIAEELRGLSKEYCLPVFSATQLNRQGFRSSDPGMEDTAESFGLPATCDLLLVIVQLEEKIKAGELVGVDVKQLKNRYTDYMHNNRFRVMVDRPKMRLAMPEDHVQETVVQTGTMGFKMKQACEGVI
jgi:replicative DNA helicase